MFFCALAAYAFARLQWPGRDKLFFAFLAALIVPGIFTTLPNFVLMRELGLLDTYLAIILPTLFMTPFSVFFLRQFFLGIPKEIEEAAMIDGAGRFRVFLRIIMPMAAAPISTLALLTYIPSWHDYFWPLLVAKDESVRVLTVALASSDRRPPGQSRLGRLMAATLMRRCRSSSCTPSWASGSSTRSASPESNESPAAPPSIARPPVHPTTTTER